MTSSLQRETDQTATAETPLSLAVYLTFHYVEARLGYLVRAVRSLYEIPAVRKDFFIYVNDVGSAEIEAIRAALQAAGIGDGVEIRPCRDLEHPYLLTWAHKPDLRRAVLSKENGYTHFIYIEDDEEITESQFAYFLKYLDPLKTKGLIPGFYRVEGNDETGETVSTDQEKRVDLGVRPHVRLGDLAFVDLKNPYMGSFILDRELATEYVGSLSFDLVGSTLRRNWGPRERAAMGLTFEKPPFPFVSRVVHPVDVRTLVPAAEAFIRHLPNTYGNDPDSPLGSLPIDSVFSGTLTAPPFPRLLLRYAGSRGRTAQRFLRVSVKNRFAPRSKVIKV